MARQIRFGTTDLPSGFAPISESYARDVQPMKLPRTDGARALTGYAGEKVLVIGGRLINGPIANLFGQSNMRAAMDSIKALCDDGPANLYLYDDRYLRNAQARNVAFSSEGYLFEKVVDCSIEFVCPDPFTYHGNEQVDTWNSPSGTRTITPTDGNTHISPVYRFTINSTSIDFTLANNSTGKQFQLSGGNLTAGWRIDVDTLEKTVKVMSTDLMRLFVAGSEFFFLRKAANELQITVTSGTLTKLETVYRYRWAP